MIEVEIIDLLYFVLQFDTKEFSFDQHRSWPKLDDMNREVERKKVKRKIPYTPYNIHENKRQVFTTDELTCHYCLKYFERKDHLKEHVKVCSKNMMFQDDSSDLIDSAGLWNFKNWSLFNQVLQVVVLDDMDVS